MIANLGKWLSAGRWYNLIVLNTAKADSWSFTEIIIYDFAVAWLEIAVHAMLISKITQQLLFYIKGNLWLAWSTCPKNFSKSAYSNGRHWRPHHHHWVPRGTAGVVSETGRTAHPACRSASHSVDRFGVQNQTGSLVVFFRVKDSTWRFIHSRLPFSRFSVSRCVVLWLLRGSWSWFAVGSESKFTSVTSGPNTIYRLSRSRKQKKRYFQTYRQSVAGWLAKWKAVFMIMNFTVCGFSAVVRSIE